MGPVFLFIAVACVGWLTWHWQHSLVLIAHCTHCLHSYAESHRLCSSLEASKKFASASQSSLQRVLVFMDPSLPRSPLRTRYVSVALSLVCLSRTKYQPCGHCWSPTGSRIQACKMFQWSKSVLWIRFAKFLGAVCVKVFHVLCITARLCLCHT